MERNGKNKVGTTAWGKRIVAGLAGVFLFAAPLGLTAEHKGAYLRLELLSGEQMEGELLAVKGEKLLLQTSTGIGAEVGISQVASLDVKRRHRLGTWLARGFLAGLSFGTLLALPFAASEQNEYGILPIAIVGGMFGGGGAVLGAIVGAVEGSPKSHDLRGRGEREVVPLLKRLARLARFPSEESVAAPSGTEAGTPVPEATRSPEGKMAIDWTHAAEFMRSHLSVTFLQAWTGVEGNILRFMRGFRYGPGNVLADNTRGGMNNGEDGKGSVVGLHEIRFEYSLSRRLAVGVLLNPIPEFQVADGRKEVPIAGQETDVHWYLELKNQACYATISYLLLPAGGRIRKNALRLQLGLGVNRMNPSGYEFAVGHVLSPAPADFIYDGAFDCRDSTVLCALAKVEAIHFFSSHLSLALEGGYRYVPLRFPGTGSGFLVWDPPGRDVHLDFTVPRGILNAGGLHAGMSIGFHF